MASFDIGILKGKPFWIRDPTEHRAEYARKKLQCCFNHAIGLPRKVNKEMPIFDYELKYMTLFNPTSAFGSKRLPDSELQSSCLGI